MTEQRLYTRAELVDLCGVDEDALVFWLRKDLLKSVVTESRKHKRFPLSELRLARVLVCLRKFGVNVRQMEDVLRFLRGLGDMKKEIPTTARLGDVLAALEDGIERDDFEALLRSRGCSAEQTVEILKSFDFIVGEEAIEVWRLYLAFEDRLPLGIMVGEDGGGGYAILPLDRLVEDQPDVAAGYVHQQVAMNFVTSIDEIAFDGMLVLDLRRLFAGLEE